MTTILRRAHYLPTIALLLGSYAVCNAQSHDVENPTPLAPGINKGNIDNKQNGPDYYYFYAGPGHVDLHYAFKEMGVFGNPMRQSLSFDLYVEDNKLIAHDAIVSVENMEKLSRPGDLGSRHKVVLRVISPDTTLRLGAITRSKRPARLPSTDTQPARPSNRKTRHSIILQDRCMSQAAHYMNRGWRSILRSAR